MANKIVKYKGKTRYVNPLRNAVNAIRFINRTRKYANQMKDVRQLANYVASNARKRRLSKSYDGKYIKKRIVNGRTKHYTTVIGRATGTTHTTSRMIVRRTPREQRFLRKLFRNRPLKQKYVNRFGFSWMGASEASRTVWYSVCHMKFNNINRYMSERLQTPSQPVGSTPADNTSASAIGNGPDAFIYVGKCTFNYELYNPTNYIITVFIYDLICKRDTPYDIHYSDATEDQNSAPEACMFKGSRSMTSSASNSTWVVADSTSGEAGASVNWNTIGMKPTDYHLFNTLWKVKGMRKVILPPGSSHHHCVVYNPKKKITKASLYYPHQTWKSNSKNGLAGITQATLFGFQGQVAVEDGISTDNTNSLGTLPGKIVVSCVKKVNIWNMDLAAQTIISENDLKTSWTKPTIFSDLTEVQAASTGGNIASTS